MNRKWRRFFPVLFWMLLCVCIPMKASAANFSLSASDVDGTQRIFRIAMNQSEIPNVYQTLFAVWGDQGGQNDLKWYRADEMMDGSYLCDVPVSNHGETGSYTVHAYVESTDGYLYMMGDTGFQVAEMQQPSYEAYARNVTAANYSASGGSFQVWVQGVQAASGVSQVQIPVWCSADQSDIQWYIADRMSDGSFMAEVSAANHGYHTGRYQVHAYVLENNGTLTFVGSTTQDVSSGFSVSNGNLTVAERGGGSSYQIDLYGASIPGLSGVQFAVWAEQGGQDDLVWYQATPYTDGSFSCTVPISNHGQAGNYNVHAYAVLSNGSVQMLRAATFYVENNLSANVQVANINENTGTFDIFISNVSAPGGVQTVQVPVWHAADQSDIRWYTAQLQSNGTYAVTANVANHNYNSGNYNIHVYVTANGGAMSCVCGTTANIRVSYTLDFAVQTRVAGDANAVIGSITNGSMDSGTKLRTCYNWVVNNISYQTLPIPLQPEAGYSQEEWYAIYGLEQRRGDCYCYAAAFAAMARQLGYSATMISGSVPLYSGGWGPHAWVEIYMNGATYICDPESQYEYPGYGFYMTTYATAPYAYRK
ncbi:hypothetical protein EBB54_13925 [Schaedlerella arabinosiphila]|uniref:Transglutaminase-like domain-containing protein n=1 Tax=Schaedlerella arabinosiphila TaxID=2044587 RepID=A0A3R8JP99_9FIRM|nr:GBS Bsp-like repeat-containing protein [uncultured Schaedlerella sp.]RRK32336.1 hypothetical protein EBB54_13925 [Schaedlerella arabinosiphila]